MNNISGRLKNLRMENNFKQRQLADYLGISQQSYSHYEQSQRELPIRHIIKIAKFYKVSTDYLLGISTYRYCHFDLNSDYIQDVPLKNILFSLNQLDRHNRLELVRFLFYLEESQRS